MRKLALSLITAISLTGLISLLLIENSFGSNPPPCRAKNSSPIPSIKIKSVTKELKAPVGLTHSSDGSGRLFIIEQEGIIRILMNGKLLKDPFLDIRDRVASGGEKGLLGLAFHPEFSKTGRFFVNYTSLSKGLKTIISEFKVQTSTNRVKPETERILLTFTQPYANHNGGHIAFGPDGLLYIGTGDGGAGNDPHRYSQNLSSLLGKMLRIDVKASALGVPYSIPRDNPFIDQKNISPEIWAFGLRNPWRFSFDSVTQLLYLGDVGQNAREEINIIKKNRNYGWPLMEGKICTPSISKQCNKKGLEFPILDYPRSTGFVVIGGYVYRGSSNPELCGVYLYADYGNGRIFGLRYDGLSVIENRMILSSGLKITSFGEDEDRELYILDADGSVLKIQNKTLLF